MRRLIVAITFIFNTSCTDAAEVQSATGSDIECSFQFGTEPVCSYKTDKHAIQVSVATKKISDTEIALVQAHVTFGGKRQTLAVSPDVAMTDGDIGVVSFADINFDNLPDVAISTSLGVANQYFDYRTYDPKLQTYKPIGNYPKLNADRAKKTLTANVKLSAAAYEAQSYAWEKGKLVRTK